MLDVAVVISRLICAFCDVWRRRRRWDELIGELDHELDVYGHLVAGDKRSPANLVSQVLFGVW
jgi:hypothetical protein